MKLADLKTGERAVVAKVSGHGSFRKRITEMGFMRGRVVSVILNAPLKDPIEYEIIGYKISLRREVAGLIEVISEEEAKLQVRESIPPIEINEGEELEREMKSLAEERGKRIRVSLVGNPNCGKTSLFNIASGSHERVGNYSGVTVDAKEGQFEYGGYTFTLVDLPGTYSLSAYSPEELFVRKNIIEEVPDVIINVVDASNLERNLYLTTQLIDMDLRMVLALNMYDELRAKGDKIDLQQLGYLLGLSIVPTVSRSGEGINELFDTVIKVYEWNDPRMSRHIHINHGTELERSIDRVKLLIQQNPDIRYKYSTRYLAIKYLEKDKDIESVIEKFPNRDEIITARVEETKRLEEMIGISPDEAITEAKYGFVQGALKETYLRSAEEKSKKSSITDKIDNIVTDKWLAFPIFFFLLFLVFQFTFTLGDYPMQWIESLVEKLGEFVGTYMPESWVKDLTVDGVIGGVGSVLVFLPNILFLYLFISLLEDSGYMARAAFIMDKLMHKMSLHGKSFIPMIMGFGCNVPAIMATRSIESRKSRLITILIIPFMSCAGRLPVYVLIAGAFFPKGAGVVMLGLYALGIVLAVLSARIISYFIKDDDLPFVMELPPYRVPTAKSVLRHTWEKGKQYLHKMAGTILVCSIIIWALGYFPHHDDYATALEQQKHSYIGMIGKTIEPVMKPLGFDWKMGVGIIAGVGAKELVVSSLGVMYSAAGASEAAAGPAVEDAGPAVEDAGVAGASAVTSPGAEMEAKSAEATSSGAEMEAKSAEATSSVASVVDDGDTALQRALLRNVTPAAALAYMVFILLYFPCIATFVAIKNETGSRRWAIFVACYTILVAWIVSFIVYRLALLF